MKVLLETRDGFQKWIECDDALGRYFLMPRMPFPSEDGIPDHYKFELVYYSKDDNFWLYVEK